MATLISGPDLHQEKKTKIKFFNGGVQNVDMFILKFHKNILAIVKKLLIHLLIRGLFHTPVEILVENRCLADNINA